MLIYRIDDRFESSSKSSNLVLDLGVHSKLGHQMHVTEKIQEHPLSLNSFYFTLMETTKECNMIEFIVNLVLP